MGGNFSLTSDKFYRDIETNMEQSCTPKSGIEQQLNNNTFIARGQAKCGNIMFNNKARTASSCEMSGISDTLAKYTNKLNEEQKIGLGIGINNSLSFSDTVEKIKNQLNSKCGAEESIKQELNNNRVEIWDQAQCNSVSFMNEADAAQTCVMINVNKAISDATKTTEKKQTVEWNTMMVTIIVIVVIIIFATAGGKFILLKFGEGSGKYVIWIVIFVI